MDESKKLLEEMKECCRDIGFGILAGKSTFKLFEECAREYQLTVPPEKIELRFFGYIGLVIVNIDRNYDYYPSQEVKDAMLECFNTITDILWSYSDDKEAESMF